MFYSHFTLIGSWEGRNNFRVGIFSNKNLIGLGYRKETTFSFRPKDVKICATLMQIIFQIFFFECFKQVLSSAVYAALEI